MYHDSYSGNTAWVLTDNLPFTNHFSTFYLVIVVYQKGKTSQHRDCELLQFTSLRERCQA